MANFQPVPEDDLPGAPAGPAPAASGGAGAVPPDDLPDGMQAGGGNVYAGKTIDHLRGEYRRAQKLGQKELLPQIADAFVRKENEEGAGTIGGFGLAIDDVIRQAAKGVPVIGAALDEINAGTSALFGGNYEEALDYNRARDRHRENLNPETSAAVQLAGGVGGSIAGLRALGVPLGVNSTTPLLQRSVTGAAAGIPVGAADFFLRGEGDASRRGTNAAVGALFGGVTGAAAPVAAQGLSSGYQRLMNYLTSDAALRRLGISRDAANVLIRQMQADDTLSATGAQRIREGGPDAMLADAGPAATNLLDTALERSGPGATAARDAIEQRAVSANRQFGNVLDQTLGAPVGVETRQAGIRTSTQAARSAAYDAAYARPIDYASAAGRSLETYLRRVPGEAVNQANRLMRAEGQDSRQILARVSDNGTVTFEQMPDVRQLDYITRGLNEVARGAEGQGALGGTTAAGRIYGNLSTEIRRRVRGLVPEYGAALDTAADPIRRIEATEFGASLLDRSTTREQVARALQGMSGAERQAVMSGVRDQIDELVANVRRMASDPNLDARQLRETLSAVSSDAARQKITFVVGDARARRLFGEVHRLARALELRANVSRNSRTFGRTSTAAQVDAQLEPGIIGTALEGRPMVALKKVIQTMTGMTPERRLAMEDRLYGEIARALTQVRGTRAEGYLNELLSAVRTRSMSRNAGREIGRAGAGVVIGTPSTPGDRLLRRPVQ